MVLKTLWERAKREAHEDAVAKGRQVGRQEGRQEARQEILNELRGKPAAEIAAILERMEHDDPPDDPTR